MRVAWGNLLGLFVSPFRSKIWKELLMSTKARRLKQGLFWDFIKTALHSLEGHIERSLHYTKYTMVAFLDIYSAFKNVTINNRSYGSSICRKAPELYLMPRITRGTRQLYMRMAWQFLAKAQRFSRKYSSLSSYYSRNGDSADPSKTELVLISRNYKIPQFCNPRLNGVALSLSETKKILDWC